MPAPRPSMKKLDFAEKLIQSGKRENTDALLKRLKTLHLKLKELDQDYTDVKSLDHVRKPLINPIIMHHKDRGVKAYAACCLADMLRLYAPDAPFTQEELRDIFQFMSTQLVSNLKTPGGAVRPLQASRGRTNTDSQQLPAASQRITDAPYYTEYYYLLENLATIRSVVLALDVPDSDEIVTSFFTGFVDIVRTDMSKTLIRHMRDILVAMIEEANPVPSGVMDCILAQFEAQQESPNTPAFMLIQDTCNRTANKLQRSIYAHFSAIQLEHGRSKDASSDEMQELKASHELILTIYRHSPALLVTFIAQLEENLRAADEIPLRQLSTRTLGTMFGMRPMVGTSTADLAKAFPAAWRAWLGRKVDKALPVRLAWVESASGILINQPDLRSEMEAELADRVHDSDEKIRTAICKTIGSLDYETALHHLSENTLRSVGGRASDKKAGVRAEAAQTLARLWSLAYSSIEANDADAVRQFAWIPEVLLAGMTRRDATSDLRAQMTSLFKTHILPLPSVDQIDEQAWVDRLLLVLSHLDDGGLKALERLTGLKGYSKGNSPYRAFIQFCEDNNGGIIDGEEKLVRARLDYVITAIAPFPDAVKARKDLEAFATANDARLYKLVKGCVDPQSDLRTIIKARNELLRRIEQSHTDILETFTIFIDSAAWNIINHSSVPALIKRLQRPEGPLADRVSTAAFQMMGLIAKECAPMFNSHIPELIMVMSDKKNELLSEVALRALASAVKADGEVSPDDKRAAERAYKKALEGTPKQAKYAARFLAYSKQKEMCGELLDDILAKVSKSDDERLLCYLRVVSELALSAPQAFAAREEEIMQFIGEVMDRESPEDDENIWVPEEELDVVDRAKLLCMRVYAHRALPHARTDRGMELFQEAVDVFKPVLKESRSQDSDDGRARHHRGLRAALCMLKLANARAFDKSMSWELFEHVAGALQVEVTHCRHKFLLKLGEILPSQRLSPRWNMLPATSAADPQPENVQLAASILTQVVRGAATLPAEQRIDLIELQLSRLLLFLSRFPDMDCSKSELESCARCIEMYLDAVATKENVSLLANVAGKIKLLKDATREDSTNLYCLSELAHLIIKQRAGTHAWPVSTYPGTIRMPREGFHNLHNGAEKNENAKRIYLNEEMQGWFKMAGKRGNVAGGVARKEAREIRRTERSSASPKKRARAPKESGSAKKRKQKREAEDEESESEEDDEDEDGEDESAVEDMTSAADSEEDEGAEAVVGRGGRRGAKTKAKKAVARKRKVKRVKRSSEEPEPEEESELSELEE